MNTAARVWNPASHSELRAHIHDALCSFDMYGQLSLHAHMWVVLYAKNKLSFSDCMRANTMLKTASELFVDSNYDNFLEDLIAYFAPVK